MTPFSDISNPSLFFRFFETTMYHTDAFDVAVADHDGLLWRIYQLLALTCNTFT